MIKVVDNLLVAKKLNQGYNEYEAGFIALQEMQETFGTDKECTKKYSA